MEKCIYLKSGLCHAVDPPAKHVCSKDCARYTLDYTCKGCGADWKNDCVKYRLDGKIYNVCDVCQVEN